MNTTTATRAELKLRAKASLEGQYWNSMVMIIVFSIATAILSYIAMLPIVISGTASLMSLFRQFEVPELTITAFSIPALVISCIMIIAIPIFVVVPLQISYYGYFINVAKGKEAKTSDLLNNFKNGGYLNTIITIFLENLFIFLWSLLFIVPGIIKTYQYFMIQYMIAENPSMDRKRAFAITKAAMAGDKWKTFVLGLSFIGWMLLGTITCGIGIIFLAPYVNVTFAHYYLELKNKAIANGIATAEEFEN